MEGVFSKNILQGCLVILRIVIDLINIAFEWVKFGYARRPDVRSTGSRASWQREKKLFRDRKNQTDALGQLCLHSGVQVGSRQPSKVLHLHLWQFWSGNEYEWLLVIDFFACCYSLKVFSKFMCWKLNPNVTVLITGNLRR